MTQRGWQAFSESRPVFASLVTVLLASDRELRTVFRRFVGSRPPNGRPRHNVVMRFSNAVKLPSSLVILLELPSSSEDILVPDLPTVDRTITIQNGGRCRFETSERSKLGLRTGKERYILFITIKNKHDVREPCGLFFCERAPGPW